MNRNDVLWILRHTTTSLPYIGIGLYLLATHYKARKSSREPDVALKIGLVLNAVMVFSFIFNQPPFRFWVSGEFNMLFKDWSIIIQSVMLSMFADALLGEAPWQRWLMRAIVSLIPLAWSVYYYVAALSIQKDGITYVPFVVTLYSLYGFGYGSYRLAQLWRSRPGVQLEWRIGAMVLGLIMTELYVAGRGMMQFADLPRAQYLVVVNRVSLTLSTLFMAIGIVSPLWYRRLGLRLHLLYHAGRHTQALIGLLGMLMDQQVRSRNASRQALLYVARSLADELGRPIESRLTLTMLANTVSLQEVTAPFIPPDTQPVSDYALDLEAAISQLSRTYELAQELHSGKAQLPTSLDAQIMWAAKLYVESADMQQIYQECGRPVGDALVNLIKAGMLPAAS